MIGAPRGTKDILPPEINIWQFVEDVSRRIFQIYGYEEIRTPIFEFTELFVRGIGEYTDIVNKEMYTFKDRKGRSLTLRPENTASVVRAYLEHNLHINSPNLKLYYFGPMFRYERPQSGRQRQFWQIGSEAFGSHDPGLDAEVIAMNLHLLSELGITKLETHINSLGCNNCRDNYKLDLIDYLTPKKNSLCYDCQEKLNRNPLRILDCKREGCRSLVKEAPTIQTVLCNECQSHLNEVCKYLKKLKISFLINPYLVRGLDYYTHTAFEIIDKDLGAMNAISAGGRYNNLIAQMGGPEIPAVGFAAGVERIILSLKKNRIESQKKSQENIIYIATTTSKLSPKGLKIAQDLRKAGFWVFTEFSHKSLKSQLRRFNKLKARYVLILGEEELKENKVGIKDLANKTQIELAIEKLKEYFIKKFYIEDSQL